MWRADANGDGGSATSTRRRVDGPVPARPGAGRARRARARGCRRRSRGAPLDVDDLRAGARAQNAAGLERLARRIEPGVGWDDLVLPPETLEQLRELAARATHRDRVHRRVGHAAAASSRGAASRRSSPASPAPARRWPPRCSRGELGLDLYAIDLATVVDKYIGETEKNLDRIFAEADGVNGVLFFDEADALFGKRSEVRDAHDRYANIEVAYLLQRMEAFDGIAILATNLRANIDEAFARRLDAVVDFPMPDEEHRLRALGAVPRPASSRATDDLDLELLRPRVRALGRQHPQHRARRGVPRRRRRAARSRWPT